MLRDFNGHDRWHPAVATSAIERGQSSDKIGCVRRFKLADGGELREQLLALSDLEQSFSYCLLDTPIRSFQVKDVNRDLAVNRLLDFPEVRAVTLSTNLKPRPPYPPSERTKDEKLSFNLSGVTLRQALNRIADDSGAKFWVFRRYADGTFEITLSCC